MLICLSFCVIFSNANIHFFSTIEVVSAEGSTNIANYNDLKEFMASVNGGVTYNNQTVKLTADIIIESDFESIGNIDSSKSFRGTFDGAGHSIYGLKVPLFAYVSDAEIKNIVIEKNISDTIATECKIESNNKYVGAIVGYGVNGTKISQCINLAEVINYHNTKTIVYTGGIVGRMNGGFISECVNKGSISNSSDKISTSYVGGIVGYAETNVAISDCFVYSENKISITANALETTSNSTFTISKRYGPLSTIVSEWVEKTKTEYIEKIVEVEKKIQEKKNLSFWEKIWYGLEYLFYTVVVVVTETIIEPVTTTFTELVEKSVGLEQYIATPIGQTSKKTIYSKNAYAYGIGYSTTNSIKNVYVANVDCYGGYSANTTYDLKLQFWANNLATGWVQICGPSFTKSLEFKNYDKQGPISNKIASNCYYLEKPDYAKTRSIIYEGNQLYGNTNAITTSHDVAIVWRDQLLRVYSNNMPEYLIVYMKVAESATSTFVTAKEFYFDSKLVNYEGITCGDSLEYLQSQKPFSDVESSIWCIDDSIQDGFPHLKFRYWHDET